MKHPMVGLVARSAIALLLAGCASKVPPAPPAPGGLPPTQQFTLRISVGDTVSVDVFQEPTLTSTQRVLPDGSITLPVAGRVDVAGKTPTDVQARLAEAYVAGGVKEPKVSVSIKEVFAAHAFFLGEVKSPGTIYLAGPTSILQGIAQVGGFLEGEADKRTIRIIRMPRDGGCKPEIYGVDVQQILCGSGCDVFLLPGDVVYVHPTGLAEWSRDLKLKLEPIGVLLGPPAQAASLILAIDSVANHR